MGAYDKVLAARAKGRPTGLAYIEHIFTDFLELHGDRRYGDDGAVVAGVDVYKRQDAYYSAFRRERNPKQIGQKNSMCSFSVRLLARLFLFSPLFSFSRKGKEGVRAPHWRNRSAGWCPAHRHITR